MRAADAAGWLAAFGAEDVAVTVRFPQLGGWEVTSWAVAPGDAEGSPALEVEIWACLLYTSKQVAKLCGSYS